MRADKVDAVVLHSRAWRETSQILDLFSAEYGRVALVSRGSRSGKRGSTSLAPFNLYQVSWSGRGELKNLTDSETRIQWQLQGERALCGLYLNELLCRLLLVEDPHPQLFASYLGACDGLDRLIEEPAAILRRFEISLLTEMGYAIALDLDASGHEFLRDKRYRYQPELGWVITDETTSLALLGSSLQALETGQLPREAEESRRLRQQLKQLLDQLLDDRPLQSRELLLQYRLKKG